MYLLSGWLHSRKLPREVVESPLLEILKTQLHIIPGNLLLQILPKQEGCTKSWEAPYNLNNSAVLSLKKKKN